MPVETKGKRADVGKPSPYSNTGPSREMEGKRARGEVSCAECRRLKIKCDRTIPCSRCTARGCASICPNGSLATGQGTRFVLAATEHLHKKISKLTDRIRLLEDALTALQAKHYDDPHPLLVPSTLSSSDVKKEEDIESDEEEEDILVPTASGIIQKGNAEVMEAFGTLTITDHGVSRFFGPTGGPESLLMTEEEAKQKSNINSPHRSPASASPSSFPAHHHGRATSADFAHGVPRIRVSEVSSDASVSSSSSPPSDRHTSPSAYAYFSSAFPFTPVGTTPQIKKLVEDHLPPYERAVQLCSVYFERAAWLFQSVSHSQVVDEMVPFFYSGSFPESGMHEPGSAFSNVDSKGEEDREDYNGPHDLALLFVVLAVGAIMDFAETQMAATVYRSSPDATREDIAAEAEHYHQIAQAAICLQPVLEKPSMATIQALHLLSIYNAMRTTNSSGSSMEMSWSLVTLCAHLSQTVGLHRDSSRWGLSPKMINRRRLLFWDIFVAQAWQSLATGRPPAFALEYVDCELPERADPSATIEPGTTPPEYWGILFAKTCVAEVAARTLTAASPSYATILELDRKVREFPVPPAVPAETPIQSVQRCVMLHIKEVVLMYIHRSFFAQALLDHPLNPLKSAYAPSFLAAYRAATTVLRAVKDQFVLTPELCSRFWSMMTHSFASAVVFGTVVTRGSKSPLAKSAFSELEQACHLFTKAAVHSHRAYVALPILTKLREKAKTCLAAKDPSLLNVGPVIKTEEDDDELSIYAGKTRYVSSRRPDSATSSPILAFPVVPVPTMLAVDTSLSMISGHAVSPVSGGGPEGSPLTGSSRLVSSGSPEPMAAGPSSRVLSPASSMHIGSSSPWGAEPPMIQHYSHEEYADPNPNYRVHDYGLDAVPSSQYQLQSQQEWGQMDAYEEQRQHAAMLQHQQQQHTRQLSDGHYEQQQQHYAYSPVEEQQAYFYGSQPGYVRSRTNSQAQQHMHYLGRPDPRQQALYAQLQQQHPLPDQQYSMRTSTHPPQSRVVGISRTARGHEGWYTDSGYQGR